MKRKAGIIVCVLILFTALSSLVWNTAKKKEPQLTTLIVVRHAEKNNETDTTTLTAEGYDRANRLAELLSTTDLAAVYTTPYTRLRLTAEPTARQKNLPIQDYTPHDISEIDRIISANLSKTVLIVGHSNTIP